MQAAGPGEAWITVDLGFGDAGKGGVVDFLARDRGACAVVRYNGGPQAAHNVVTPDGRQHAFQQFGAGSFVPGVRTHLGHAVAIEPIRMMWEERALVGLGIADAWTRTTVDRRALVVTPFHKLANRWRELTRGAARHGSCGLGVGEAREDQAAGRPSLEASDLLGSFTSLVGRLRGIAAEKLRQLGDDGVLQALDASARRALEELDDPGFIGACAELYTMWARTSRVVDGDAELAGLLASGPVIFEGAHGVLLDEVHGFHPYSTWADTTPRPALDLLKAAGFSGQARILGLTRTYAVRYGPGPLPTEDDALGARLPEPHNVNGQWQGPFRVGWPDGVLLKYARDVIGHLDGLAVTHLDRFPVNGHAQVCESYGGDRSPAMTTRCLFAARPDYIRPDGPLLEWLEARAGAKAWITSRGQTWCDKTATGAGAAALT